MKDMSPHLNLPRRPTEQTCARLQSFDGRAAQAVASRAARRGGRSNFVAAVLFGGRLCFAVLVLLALARTASATIDVYQIRGSNDFGIYVLNTAGGNDQRLFAGTYPGGSSATLAQRPSDGMLFYVINGTNAQIYSYNPATPAVAPVALPNTLGAGIPGSFRMAFSPNGTLYYMPDTGILYTIATTGVNAGQATAGPTVTGLGSGGDMAFINNTSFYVINSSRQLFTCSTAGGAAAPVGGAAGGGTITFPAGATPATLGLAFDSAGRLLTQTQNPSNYYVINIAARTAAVAGTLGGGTTPTGDMASANVPDPNLSITKTNNVTSVYQGMLVTYSVVVTNNGTYAVTGTVADTVPATLTGVTWACTASAGSTCTTASGAGNAINTSATLAAAGTATYTITGTLTASSGTLANTATVAVPTWLTDSNTGNNTATDSDPIVAAANIAITKTAATTFAVGSNASYTLAVSNAGPQSAAGIITVTDNLPAGLSYVSGTGTNWTCSNVGAAVTCTHPGPIANAGSLPAITLTVSVAVAAAPNVTNSATVSSPTFDPTPANNTSTITTPVLYILLQKAFSITGNPTPGNDITYTVTFTNMGGAAVQNLTIVDMVPLNTDFRVGSATSSHTTVPVIQYSNVARTAITPPPTPSPFTLYTPPGANGTYDPQVNWVRWTFPASIPASGAGSSGSVTFVVRIR